jgi:hypothetical protein
MDRPRGAVRFVHREAVPADAEGAYPASHHSQPRCSRRIARHESIGKGTITRILFINNISYLLATYQFNRAQVIERYRTLSNSMSIAESVIFTRFR